MTRRIETVAELEALPVGSVVLDAGGLAWQKQGRTVQSWWYSADGGEWDAASDELDDMPITLLHDPTATSDAATPRLQCRGANPLDPQLATMLSTPLAVAPAMEYTAPGLVVTREAVEALHDENFEAGDYADGFHAAIDSVVGLFGVTVAADGEGNPRATHPAHWERHGHPGDPCPPYGCYGGAQYGATEVDA